MQDDRDNMKFLMTRRLILQRIKSEIIKRQTSVRPEDFRVGDIHDIKGTSDAYYITAIIECPLSHEWMARGYRIIDPTQPDARFHKATIGLHSLGDRIIV